MMMTAAVSPYSKIDFDKSMFATKKKPKLTKALLRKPEFFRADVLPVDQTGMIPDLCQCMGLARRRAWCTTDLRSCITQIDVRGGITLRCESCIHFRWFVTLVLRRTIRVVVVQLLSREGFVTFMGYGFTARIDQTVSLRKRHRVNLMLWMRKRPSIEVSLNILGLTL